MRRRVFLSAVCAFAGAPLAFAQAVRRIAILEYGDKTARAENWRVLLARLRELGYAEGMNLAVERRWAGNTDALLPALSQELLVGKPEVIVVTSTPATQTMMQATSNVPIVFIGAADPVASGLVASLARPGGNVTGLSWQLSDVAVKRFELMREIVPNAKRFALLGPQSNIGVQEVLTRLQAAARSVGADMRLMEASDAGTISGAFERLRSEPVDALLVASVLAPFNGHIVQLAAKHRIPASYIQKGILDAGGLLVFGPDSDPSYRRAAEFVHRILRGTKPADLPIEQPKIFWVGVNLKTARALGLKIPQGVLVRADRVIE